jgi:putative hydrolase of the HAD superfamily
MTNGRPLKYDAPVGISMDGRNQVGVAVRAVLFDLDDTITDRAATVQAYAVRLLADYGAQLQLDTAAVLAKELARIDDNGYNLNRARDLAGHAAWKASPGVDILAEHWREHFAALTEPRAGLLQTVDALVGRGLRLGVVTNGPTQKQQRKIDVLGLRARVSAVLVSEAFGAGKPDPRIFHAAAAELGVQPEECVFIGDNPEKDVAGAANAGMRAVWFRATLPWPASLVAPRESVGALGEVLELPGLRPRTHPRT